MMSNSSQRETARDQSIGLRLGTGLNISPQTTFVLNGVTAYLSSETSRDKSSKSHFCHQTLAGFVAFWRIGSRRYTGRPWRVRSRRFSAEAKRWPSSTRKYRVYAVGFPVNPTRLGFCSADTESTKTAVTKPTSSGQQHRRWWRHRETPTHLHASVCGGHRLARSRANVREPVLGACCLYLLSNKGTAADGPRSSCGTQDHRDDPTYL